MISKCGRIQLKLKPMFIILWHLVNLQEDFGAEAMGSFLHRDVFI
jgi:hypothetical protein